MNRAFIYGCAIAGWLAAAAPSQAAQTQTLVEQANSWTKGQPIPSGLLSYRKSSGLAEIYVPGREDTGSVIGSITNTALLVEMLFDPKIDPRVFAEAVSRSLHLSGPQAFFGEIKRRYQKRNEWLLFPLHKRLFTELNQRHAWVDALFITEADMPAEEAFKTFRQMINELQSGKNWEALYAEYSRNLRGDSGISVGGEKPVELSKLSRFGPIVLCEQTKPGETMVSDELPKDQRLPLLQGDQGHVLLIHDAMRRRVVLYRIREVYLPKVD